MDTLYAERPDFCTQVLSCVLNCAVIGLIVSSQIFIMTNPMLADDLKLANASVNLPKLDTGQITAQILNEISPKVRKENFDKRVKQRFPKAIIADVQGGVKHIKLTKYYDGKPVKINVVIADTKLAKNITIKPALSSSALSSRKTISTIAKNSNAIAAINGTFFKPQTGVPLGTLMIDKKLYTGPISDRVAMGFFDDGFDMARVQLNASVKGDKETIRIDNINQPRMLSSYVLIYTSEWGKLAPASPKYGAQMAIADGKILKMSANRLEIPENGYVLVGPKAQLNKIAGSKKAEVNISTIPEWKDVNHIISGGPYLVKNGEVFVDMTAQKLGAIGGKNPRSAIGYTKENELVIAAVDGREGSSVGMTLMQLANFMKQSGCVNAMNLDGGGSTVMYVSGKVVNKPAVIGGIPVSNALVLQKS